MGPLDFDKLVRAPDGLARPWVFGSKDDKGRNVAKYLETHPTIQTDAPDEQVANFALDGGGMHVGYTRRDGRWLITTGLFCGG